MIVTVYIPQRWASILHIFPPVPTTFHHSQGNLCFQKRITSTSLVTNMPRRCPHGLANGEVPRRVILPTLFEQAHSDSAATSDSLASLRANNLPACLPAHNIHSLEMNPRYPSPSLSPYNAFHSASLPDHPARNHYRWCYSSIEMTDDR